MCQSVSAARNGRPVWPEKNWSLPKKIALRNGAGFTGSIGDGAMWVSEMNTARTSRNSAIVFSANGSRFGRWASSAARIADSMKVPYTNAKRTL